MSRYRMLSKNFSLDEFLVSQTAARHGIVIPFPPPDILANIQRLVDTVLQPLRDYLSTPVVISSGWRPEPVNTLVGGSKRSAHRYGLAADITVPGYKPHDICLVISQQFTFDQLILEFGSWVHIGIADSNKQPRNQVFTASKTYRNGRYKTAYRLGIHEGSNDAIQV